MVENILNNPKVKISTIALLELYCHLRASERGLDAVEDSEWDEFKKYYSTGASIAIQKCCLEARALAGEPKSKILPKPSPLIGVLCYCWNKHCANLRIDRNLLANISEILTDFIFLLTSNAAIPEMSRIQAALTRISSVRSILEKRYRGVKGLIEAKSITHCFRNERLRHYSFSDILAIHGRP